MQCNHDSINIASSSSSTTTTKLLCATCKPQAGGENLQQ